MSATKDQLSYLDFAFACYRGGTNAAILSGWLTEHGFAATAMAGITTPLTGATLRKTGNSAGNNDAGSMDQVILAKIQSTPAGGVTRAQLQQQMLDQYRQPSNQFGASIRRLAKKNWIIEKGQLLTAGKVTVIDHVRTRKGANTVSRKRASTANATTTQPQAQTG